MANPISAAPAALGTRVGRLLSNLLIVLGVLFLLAATTYVAYALLKTWLIGQDRYLVSHEIAPLPVPAMTWTPSPTHTHTPTPTRTATPAAHHTALSTTAATSTTSPQLTAAPTLPPTFTATPFPSPTPSPSPSPTERPAAPAAKIRIPALNITRSIVELPRTRDRRTGASTWNTKRLFRSGRKDLVGHSQGSANPGEEGNAILVGHNYGYGYNGVFVRLGRLKPGKKIYVTNKVGQTFTYEVQRVKRVKWRRQDFGELTQHLSFLSTGGPERLTLVSCAGADVEPFPERIYVVAEPVGR